MSIPDPVKALRTDLLADAGVAALAATRVHGAELNRETNSVMPVKAVVIRKSGLGASGGNRSRVEISSPRVDVFCYGETPFEAARLDLAVYEYLKQMTPHVTNECYLLDAVLVSGPVDLREEDTSWPLVFRSYTVTAAEAVAA